jgi:ABC-type transport system substrate-binding protein
MRRLVTVGLLATLLLTPPLICLSACGGDSGGGGTEPVVKVTLSYGNNSRPYMPSPSSVATQIAIALRDVGFDVTLQKKEWASYLQMAKNGEHQMALLGWSADYPDADNFLYVLLDKETPRPAGPATSASTSPRRCTRSWSRPA